MAMPPLRDGEVWRDGGLMLKSEWLSQKKPEEKGRRIAPRLLAWRTPSGRAEVQPDGPAGLWAGL
ncbi:MAG: hypothetical protein WC876_10010 [Candidatus Thermoplasmatota archaeon]|jgi:hypothetical protein